ncbi:MAG: AMP-binding protein [Xanthomonadales bacterium]|nr:AMP-binding protein [Xanthomonadales bacterium]
MFSPRDRAFSARADAADPIAVSGTAQAWTRSRLTERCSALAERLTALDLQVVALHMDNRPEWIVIDMACQAASVCLVPLPGFFSPAQLRHILNTVPIDGVLTEQPEMLSPLCADRLRPGMDLPLGGSTLLRLKRVRNTQVLPAGTGKITFTSGSTGRPKGVCLSNGQLQAQAAALAAAVGLEQPRHLCLLPLSTLLENVAGVYAPLLSGGEVVVPTLAEIGFYGSSSLDTGLFLEQISQQQPNSILLTPQLLQILVSAAGNGWQPPASLVFAAVGGAKVPVALLQRARALGIPAFEGYGLSECASVVSLNRPGRDRPGSCGQPLAQLGITVDDGEIRVAGNAMLGYAGEPESWGQDQIATGDLGYLDNEGFLYINGRKKNLLITSFGRNIAPEWVESEALASGVLAECVVVGDARPFCIALLSPRNPAAADETIQSAIDDSNARLPDYAHIRRWHRLVQPLADSSELITENGRPKRHAIITRYQSVIDALYAGDTCAAKPYARTA